MYILAFLLQIINTVNIACVVPISTYYDMRKIYNTWGKKCDAIRFFIEDFKKPDNFKSSLIVSVKTHRYPVKNLWEKILLMWKYTSQHLQKFDWYVKADTDTYVFMENLRMYLEMDKYRNLDYMGHSVEHNGKYPYASGGLYIISSNTLTRIFSILDTRKCPITLGHFDEDVHFSLCLRQLGIYPKTILDLKYRETILLLPLKDHVNPSFKSKRQYGWYYNGLNSRCCSNIPIAFHELKNNYEFETLHNYLNYSGSYKSWMSDTKQYLKSVRKKNRRKNHEEKYSDSSK